MWLSVMGHQSQYLHDFLKSMNDTLKDRYLGVWHCYIQAEVYHLTVTMKKRISKKDNIGMYLLKLSFLENLFRKYANETLQWKATREYGFLTVKKVSGQLIFNTKLYMHLRALSHSRYSFDINATLGLNITFKHFHSSFVLPDFCRYGLIVSSSQDKNSPNKFTFCLSYPEFHLYPKFDVTFIYQAQFCISQVGWIIATIVFQVQHVDLVESMILQQAGASNTLQTALDTVNIYCLGTKGHFLHYFRITSFEFQNLVIIIGGPMKVTLHDGPGLLSPTLDVDSLTNVSTNQCLIKLHHNTQLYIQELTNQTIEYKTQNNRNIQIVKITGKTMITISSHRNSLFNILRICVLFIQAPRELHVNVSINLLSFEGTNHYTCGYGGSVLYNTAQSTTEVFPNETDLRYRYCSSPAKYEHAAKPRKFLYSRNNSMVLVLYSYAQYSQLEYSLTIWVTRCMPLHINPHDNFQVTGTKDINISYARPGSTMTFVLAKNTCAVFEIQMRTDKKWKGFPSDFKIKPVIAMSHGEATLYHITGSFDKIPCTAFDHDFLFFGIPDHYCLVQNKTTTCDSGLNFSKAISYSLGYFAKCNQLHEQSSLTLRNHVDVHILDVTDYHQVNNLLIMCLFL